MEEVSRLALESKIRHILVHTFRVVVRFPIHIIKRSSGHPFFVSKMWFAVVRLGTCLLLSFVLLVVLLVRLLVRLVEFNGELVRNRDIVRSVLPV